MAAVAVQNDPSENWISWNSLDKASYAGYLSGTSLFSGVLTYPFYVLTTRQQAGSKLTGDVSSGYNIGIRQAIRQIGWRGLYRGVIMSNMFYMPSSVTYLSITENSREHINKTLRSLFPDTRVEYTDVIQVLCSGALANGASLLISNPVNCVVSKMIVQKKGENVKFMDMCKYTYRSYGWKGFMHGFGSNFMHGTMGSAVWWWSYITSRRISTQYLQQNHNMESPYYVDALSGFAAGFVSTILVHPLDTIASKVMTGATSSTSLIGALKEVILNHGIRALWKGIVPSMAGTAASSCVFAMSYEFIKRSSSA